MSSTVAAAVAAATSVARAHGVRVEEPVVLADGANVVACLQPAPLVAQVAATTHLVREPAAWLARELAVAAHLRRAGVPVVQVSDLLAPQVHEKAGHLMSFWRHLPHDPSAQVEPHRLGTILRELRRLHATAWTCLYAERLPVHRERAAALLASWG